MELANRILNLRRAKGISQERLAELAGVSRQTVSKWECGTVQPNAENIKLLSDIFCVSADYFFTDTPLPSVSAESGVKTVKKEKTVKKKPEKAQREPAVVKDGKRGLTKYVVGISVIALALAVMVFLTVWFGLASVLQTEVFIIMLVATSFVFATEATLSVLFILKLKNKNYAEEILKCG